MTSNFLKSNKKIISFAAVAVLLASTASAFMPSNVPANADSPVCQLNWGLNGGRTTADGTGLRRIGEGANWSINVSGLPYATSGIKGLGGASFRLDNTNLSNGRVTSNGTPSDPFPLLAKPDGTFSLYDNTTIDTDGRYTVGVYKTELITESGLRVACTPSFIIEGTGTTPPVTPPPSGACADIRGNLTAQVFTTDSFIKGSAGTPTAATATVTNNSDCTYTISIASYKMYKERNALDTSWVTTQTLFDSKTVTIGPRQTIGTNVLRVSLPDCRFQVDVAEGVVLTPPTYTLDNAPHTVLAFEFGTGPLCVGTTPPPPPPPLQPSGHITANPNPCLIALGSEACTSFISWNTQNVTKARVYVYSVADNTFEKLFGEAVNFNNDAAPWIKANIVYTFRLFDYSSGARGALLDEVAVTGIPQNPPPPPLAPTVDLKVNGSDGPITINSGTAGTLTWSSNRASACTASSAPATSFSGARAVQNSAGESTGALTQATTFTIICTNTVGSASDAVTVNVTIPVANLVCSPSSQSANIGQNATFTASGATGTYSWTTSPSGNPANGTGASFTTNFGSSGSKSITVSSGSQNATCTLNVNDNGGGGDTRGFNINKRVLNVSRGDTSFSDAISAYPGDRLRFEIRIETTGNSSQNNVIVSDQLPSQISWIPGTVRQDGASIGNESELFGNGRNLGTLSAGTTRVITFEANVAGSGSFSGSTTIVNSGTVRSDQVGTNRDDSAITVNAASNFGFSLRKSAWNETQSREATSTVARPGDVIAYTLYYRNTGANTNTGVVILDDLSGIKQYSRVTDMGGAVSVDGSIRYAPVDVAAGVEVSRTFRVTINDAAYLPVGAVTMTNVYGNTVTITISRTAGPAAPLKPPRTGPGEWLMGTLAALSTSGYWIYKKKRLALAK